MIKNIEDRMIFYSDGVEVAELTPKFVLFDQDQVGLRYDQVDDVVLTIGRYSGIDVTIEFDLDGADNAMASFNSIDDALFLYSTINDRINTWNIA